MKIPRLFTGLLGGAFIAILVFSPAARFLCLLVLSGLKNSGHQEFAQNGIEQIEPAWQMEELFDDCRHSIVYGGGGQPLWNADAYFGGRYQLTMQVPVRIHSSETGEMSGEPEFLLLEVIEAGDHQASFGQNFRFDLDQWRKVYNAEGDFGAIGFEIDPTPVPGFDEYTASCRK